MPIGRDVCNNNVFILALQTAGETFLCASPPLLCSAATHLIPTKTHSFGLSRTFLLQSHVSFESI